MELSKVSYFEVRNNVGIFEHCAKGILLLYGKDAIEFLQRISTNDITKLFKGGLSTSILVTEKGKIVDILTLYNSGNYVVALTSENNVTTVITWLERFIITEDIMIKNISDDYFFYSVIGENSFNVLQEYFQSFSWDNHVFEIFNNSDNLFDVLLFREKLFTLPAFSLIVKKSKETNLKKYFREKELHSIFQIESGIPGFGYEFSQDYNPLEVGLTALISTTKGCYIGQEVLARLDTYGKVKKKISGFILGREIPILLSNKIFQNGIEAGFFTSSTYSFLVDKYIALGYIYSTYSEHSHLYLLLENGEHFPIQITELPFSK